MKLTPYYAPKEEKDKERRVRGYVFRIPVRIAERIGFTEKDEYLFLPAGDGKLVIKKL